MMTRSSTPVPITAMNPARCERSSASPETAANPSRMTTSASAVNTIGIAIFGSPYRSNTMIATAIAAASPVTSESGLYFCAKLGAT